MTTIFPTLSDLENLARGAGKIVLSRFQTDHQIERKLTTDIVTEADALAEGFIIGEIQKRWANHSIVAEESGESRQSSEYCWYIDPLDGTINYAHGLPVFCVSIGLTFRNKLLLGAVFSPCRNEMYSAETGKGAFLNGKRMHVTSTSELRDGVLMLEYPNMHDDLDEKTLQNYQNLRMSTRGIRQLGCAALAMCYTASGSADAYWQPEIHPWDIAAGTLLVKEAGGKVSDFSGKDIDLSGNTSIIAGNPLIYDIMMKVIGS